MKKSATTTIIALLVGIYLLIGLVFSYGSCSNKPLLIPGTSPVVSEGGTEVNARKTVGTIVRQCFLEPGAAQEFLTFVVFWGFLFAMIMFGIPMFFIPIVLMGCLVLFIKKKTHWAVVTLGALILLLFPPFVQTPTITSNDDQKSVAFGFPIAFIIQDQQGYDPPFPFETRLYSALENPTRIKWPALFFDYFLSFGILLALWKIGKNWHKEKQI